MNKTVKAADGTTIGLCSYQWTDPEGHVQSCRAHAKCPICQQCSKIIDGKETGHCTGHLGLMGHILETVPSRGTV